MEDRREMGVLGVNIVYLVTAILLLTVGFYLQSRDIKTGLIITEYVLVLLPPLIYIKIRGDSIKRVLRLNKLKIKHAMLAVAIAILSYPIALFFNLIVMILISRLGNIEPPPIPTANNIGEYFLLMMIIAISAGICEEVFFRGLVMRGYEMLGQKNAIVISAVLFGLFHFNIQNFAGPVVLGLVFGYLVYRTDSLLAGIIGHMTNNGVAVTIGFIVNLANDKLLNGNVSTTHQNINTFQLVISTFFMGFIAVIAGIGVYFLLRILIKDTKNRNNIEEIEELQVEKNSILVFTPIGITVIIFMYVAYIQLTNIMN